jgi:hypothetical protein
MQGISILFFQKDFQNKIDRGLIKSIRQVLVFKKIKKASP